MVIFDSKILFVDDMFLSTLSSITFASGSVKLIKNIEDTSLTVKKRISAVRTFRNYRFQKAIPKLIEVSLDQNQDDELRITLLEALGWFTFSSQRKDILNACNEVLSRKDEKESVAQVALMTKNRLLEGPTNSITP